MPKILIKRGLHANIGTALLGNGEPAWVTDTGKLYIGTGGNGGVDKVLINNVEQPSSITISKTFTKIKVNEYGLATETSYLDVADIPKLAIAQVTGLGTVAQQTVGSGQLQIPVLDSGGKYKVSHIPTIHASSIAGLGTAALANTGETTATVPLLDTKGRLSNTIFPDLGVKTVFTPTNQGAMILLPAQKGDIAVRNDIHATFILKQEPAKTIENWIKMLVPTNKVTSVNTKAGVVVLDATHVALTGYVKASAVDIVRAGSSLLDAIATLDRVADDKILLRSGNLTGTATSPTPTITDSSTRIATTAYVNISKNAYAPLLSPAFSASPKSTTVPLSDNSESIATTEYVQQSIRTIDGGTF